MKTKESKEIEPEKELSFDERYKAFKTGESTEAPVMYKSLTVKVNSNDRKVILTCEELDRDGEVVELDGMKLPEYMKENGIPMIDSHTSHSSVTTNGLGAFRNPRVEIVEGKKALVLDPDFAPTPNGKIAEILYMGVNGGKPYFTNVSMGFMVYDYDNQTKHIKEWEPYEGSLVTVGANRGARFVSKSANVEGNDEQIAKDLARFKQISTPFKEFTRLFLSDEFCERIGYFKDGDMLVDINAIYDIVSTKFVVEEKVAPLTTQEAPEEPKQKTISSEDIQNAIDLVVLRAFEKL